MTEQKPKYGERIPGAEPRVTGVDKVSPARHRHTTDDINHLDEFVQRKIDANAKAKASATLPNQIGGAVTLVLLALVVVVPLGIFLTRFALGAL